MHDVHPASGSECRTGFAFSFTPRAVKAFGVEPTSTADALALSEAVLEIAAQPAAYGVDPADAAQAVRLYFAS